MVEVTTEEEKSNFVGLKVKRYLLRTPHLVWQACLSAGMGYQRFSVSAALHITPSGSSSKTRFYHSSRGRVLPPSHSLCHSLEPTFLTAQRVCLAVSFILSCEFSFYLTAGTFFPLSFRTLHLNQK